MSWVTMEFPAVTLEAVDEKAAGLLLTREDYIRYAVQKLLYPWPPENLSVMGAANEGR